MDGNSKVGGTTRAAPCRSPALHRLCVQQHPLDSLALHSQSGQNQVLSSKRNY